MNRKGMDMVMELVVVGVVLLILSVIVIYGARGGIGDFNNYVGNNQHSSAINTCQTKVSGYCQMKENSGNDWTGHYPECAQYNKTLSTDSNINPDGSCAS